MQEFKLRVTGPDLETARNALEAADDITHVQPFGSAERSGPGAEPIETVPPRLDVTLTSPNAKTALDYVRDLLKDLRSSYDVTLIA
jgi:hypothetical protein